jgi:hypothetical protein
MNDAHSSALAVLLPEFPYVGPPHENRAVA